jgi:hypothetical protein
MYGRNAGRDEIREQAGRSPSRTQWDSPVCGEIRGRLPHFASAARITRLSSDPNKGMAGRCAQGLIDVLEGNYGGDMTKMPYVVNKEAFGK